MPRIKKPLTVKELNALPDGRHAVGGVRGLTVEKRAGKITGYRLRYFKGGTSDNVYVLRYVYVIRGT